MAHTCPECGILCHCHGDIDDCQFDSGPEQDRCDHCEDERGEPCDDDQGELDAEADFRNVATPKPNTRPAGR